MQGRSVLDEAIAGSGRVGRSAPRTGSAAARHGRSRRADDMDRILARFGEVQEEYEHLGGYTLEAQAREVLHGLGFEDDQIDGDVGRAFGRLEDARGAGARAARPARRAADGRADQPPRHRIHHLAGAVPQVVRPGALLMTSHDREFMNRVVSKIAEIDGARSSRTPAITISTSASAPSARAISRRRFARQQAMLAKEQRFIERFKTHAAKAAQVQSRIKALDKIEKIELPKKRQVVKFEFRVPPRSGDQVAVIEDLHKRYGRA
jgi:ATPase subunit of ABC transporter with duplicated ATPase domains